MKPFAGRLAMLAVVVFLSACSSGIAPLPTASAVLGPDSESLIEMRDGVAISTRIDQLSVQPYQLIDNLASFHITIDNRTDRPVVITSDAFVLRDDIGRQYRTVSPERVREIVSKDTVYLIPYPYVGYYYLDDQERGAFVQATASSLPFYAEYHPQDIFARALPAGPVLARSKVEGVIYFLADPARTARFEIVLYADSTLQGDPLYRFPFGIAK